MTLSAGCGGNAASVTLAHARGPALLAQSMAAYRNVPVYRAFHEWMGRI